VKIKYINPNQIVAILYPETYFSVYPNDSSNKPTNRCIKKLFIAIIIKDIKKIIKIFFPNGNTMKFINKNPIVEKFHASICINGNKEIEFF
jgi:hypothetical protein